LPAAIRTLFREVAAQWPDVRLPRAELALQPSSSSAATTTAATISNVARPERVGRASTSAQQDARRLHAFHHGYRVVMMAKKTQPARERGLPGLRACGPISMLATYGETAAKGSRDVSVWVSS
jgi:hypothetical protein